MSKRIAVIWTVTEQHGREIEVPDEFDEDVDLTPEFLAAYEDNESYTATTDRTIDGWEQA